MSRIAFLGYGRFGAALGGLFQEAGHTVRAFDPVAPVPASLRAASVAELGQGAELVVVAVPVPRMRAALELLAPVLEPAQLVIDVGSVKMHPAEAMRAVLGERVPWVATHPLFGPVSLARGERPLSVVVCPSPLHPGAAERVRRMYEGIGCRVLEQTPEAHDRLMAWTHALAFFVAKGMVDAGVPLDVAYAPPSLQAIARTIDAVRADAGHLFAALHRENPSAAEARRRLLDALSAIDRSLAEPEEDGAEPALTSLAFSDLGAHSPELRETRELIDEVDQEIVALLGRRAQLARRALRAKAAMGRGVQDPAREARLLASRRAWALAAGLEPEPVAAIFEAILQFSRRLQA